MLRPGIALLDINTRDAHNSKTGENFARVPCPPRTSTPPAPPPTTPQVGPMIWPKIGIGVGGSSSDPTYLSTDVQAPSGADAR